MSIGTPNHTNEYCHCYGCARRFRRKVARHPYEADRAGRTTFTSIKKYNVRRGWAKKLARRVGRALCPCCDRCRDAGAVAAG